MYKRSLTATPLEAFRLQGFDDNFVEMAKATEDQESYRINSEPVNGFVPMSIL